MLSSETEPLPESVTVSVVSAGTTGSSAASTGGASAVQTRKTVKISASICFIFPPPAANRRRDSGAAAVPDVASGG